MKRPYCSIFPALPVRYARCLPKVAELLRDRFPKMMVRYVDTELSPLISGQFRVFTIPTILIWFEGKEQGRFSRNISLHQLEESISRAYSMVFE